MAISSKYVAQSALTPITAAWLNTVDDLAYSIIDYTGWTTGTQLTITDSGVTVAGTLAATSFAGAVAATTLSASGAVSGAGFTALFASPPAIGGTAAAAITGTTITATTAFAGALNGTVGATTPAAGTFTTLIGTTIDGPIGSVTPASGVFTTLNATGGGALTGTWTDLGSVTTVDINGGTADGVTIGGASAAAGTFTTLTATGAFTSLGIDDNATSVRLNISDSGIGEGVTPYANTFNTGGISLQDHGGLLSYIGNFYISTNAYYNSGWKYKASYHAGRIILGSDGTMVFSNTASAGSAGAAATFAEKLRIQQAGHVGFGVTPATYTNRTTLAMGGSSNGMRLDMVDNASVVLGAIHSDSAGGITYDADPAAGKASSYHAWNVDGAEKMRLDDTGLLTLSAGQVNFPDTQNSSSDANTLDDYEEGTWTPVIYGTSTAGTGTYTSQLGTYTKIGRVVHITMQVAITAHTGTGNMRISGLPFAASLGTIAYAPLAGPHASNVTLSANNHMICGIYNSQSYIELLQEPTGGGAQGSVPMDTSCTIYAGGTYQAAT